MTVEIVIAKYKEDVSWTQRLTQHYTIYDKSNDPIFYSYRLPNIGREPHTYLYHIIKNYDNLADITVFLQGDPVDHCDQLGYSIDNIVLALNSLHKDMKFSSFFKVEQFDLNFEHYRFILNSKIFKEHICFFVDDKTIDMTDIMNKNLSYFIDGMNLQGLIMAGILAVPSFSAGAQYIVPKANILARPLSFWKKLFRICQSPVLMLESNYRFLDAYSFERMWPLLFSPEVEIHPNFLDSEVPRGDGKVEVVLVSEDGEKLPCRRNIIHSCCVYLCSGKKRHSYHYLNHIVENYDNLADVTVFTKEPSAEKYTTYLKKMNEIQATHPLTLYDAIIVKDIDIKYYKIIEKLKIFNTEFSQIREYFSISQYCVPKANLLSRPLSFWKKVRDLSLTDILDEDGLVVTEAIFEKILIFFLLAIVHVHPEF
jgi:Protein of unknown function (DUF3431)